MPPINSRPAEIKASWSAALKNKPFRRDFFISLVLLIILLIILSRFLIYVETREGSVLTDPILNLFSPLNLSWVIFFVIYAALFSALYNFISSPGILLTGIQVYSLLIVIRIISMYLVPLEPPSSMIVLKDPLVELFGTGESFRKDLFFSGHTATLYILYLTAKKGILKNILLICVFLVASFVLIQHVHYTIDILGALFFTYGCYSIVIKLKKMNRDEYGFSK